MLPMQVFLILIICAILARLVLRLRGGRISRGQFAVWFALWAGSLVLTVFQDYTGPLAHAMGIGRGVDFVMYLSFVLVFYFLLRISLALERLNRDITRLVRAHALEDVAGDVAAGVMRPPLEGPSGSRHAGPAEETQEDRGRREKDLAEAVGRYPAGA